MTVFAAPPLQPAAGRQRAAPAPRRGGRGSCRVRGARPGRRSRGGTNFEGYPS